MRNLLKKLYLENRLFQTVIGITCLFFFTVSASAQVDTVKPPISKIPLPTNVTTGKAEIKKLHSPKKAALLSTALPGLGQVYNKKYWKIPIIYGGFAALGYFINTNQTKYVQYRNAYRYRIDADSTTIDDYVGKYTDDNLNTLQSYYHRYRDLSVIGVALLYVLNIVDASVDAHLFTFNVDDNLSFHLHPALINTASVNHYTTGFSLSIKF